AAAADGLSNDAVAERPAIAGRRARAGLRRATDIERDGLGVASRAAAAAQADADRGRAGAGPGNVAADVEPAAAAAPAHRLGQNRAGAVALGDDVAVHRGLDSGRAAPAATRSAQAHADGARGGAAE